MTKESTGCSAATSCSAQAPRTFASSAVRQLSPSSSRTGRSSKAPARCSTEVNGSPHASAASRTAARTCAASVTSERAQRTSPSCASRRSSSPGSPRPSSSSRVRGVLSRCSAISTPTPPRPPLMRWKPTVDGRVRGSGSGRGARRRTYRRPSRWATSVSAGAGVSSASSVSTSQSGARSTWTPRSQGCSSRTDLSRPTDVAWSQRGRSSGVTAWAPAVTSSRGSGRLEPCRSISARTKASRDSAG